jgi:hypothetical protein
LTIKHWIEKYPGDSLSTPLGVSVRVFPERIDPWSVGGTMPKAEAQINKRGIKGENREGES